MDPISQLGWRNRHRGLEGPAAQLMRDVMEAADVVHSDAMSERVASSNNDEHSPFSADPPILGQCLNMLMAAGAQRRAKKSIKKVCAVLNAPKCTEMFL